MGGRGGDVTELDKHSIGKGKVALYAISVEEGGGSICL